MTQWIDHLAILPVLLPLVGGALLIPFDERWRRLKGVVAIAFTLGCLVVAIAVLRLVDTPDSGSIPQVFVYRLGNWPAPFGIVLVLDRLSALMLVLTSVLALAALAFSFARWANTGSYYHSLFLFLFGGLNGAFLTGDLFNLFVFFEILLAASYGLVLHGSGRARVQAGLHYIAVNLVASSLFLLGVSLIYGVTGTLNMADVAMRAPTIADGDRTLFRAGAALLGVAFLVKAGMWPLGFWLRATYAAAAAPVAAFFAIMTKVGIYIVLRLSLLMFGADAGAWTHFGSGWLIAGGMMTVAFGSIAILASQDLARLASYCVLISSGTLLAVIGMDSDVFLTGSALFYLVSSTLALGAFFMLSELVERGRAAGADVIAVTMEAYGDEDEEDLDETEVGVAFPATMAILGLSFVGCALILAGFPPFSGFIAKFMLLKALLQEPAGADAGSSIDGVSWMLLALLLSSGFAAVIAFARAGIRIFWLPLEATVPRVRLIEIAPILGLLLLCGVLTVQAGPVMRFVEATAESLHATATYVHGVLGPNWPPSPDGERP
jgi:multicomponent K+:H+ antiporter subunit D